MNSFGEYLRDKREQAGLPLRKIAAELDIDTSVLSKIERGERTALKGMLPILAKTLNIQQKEIEVEFIKAIILSEVGNLKFLKIGLNFQYVVKQSD
jgi:transcriptional regulator with XRE-family HTH domain